MMKPFRNAGGLTILGIVLSLSGPGAIAALSDRYLGAEQPLAVRALGLMAFVILLAAVVLIAVRGERLTGADVGFGRLSRTSIAWAIGLTCFLALVFGPLSIAALARTGFGSFDPAVTAALVSLPTWYLTLTI